MEKITITFNELRRIKDSLPHGSMQRIADALDIAPDTVRNYFGATNFINGSVPGVHFEQGGPDGGIVAFDDPAILNMAKDIIKESQS
ncbi:MAG: DNA-binding protein [Prevotellaceae bacterium]|jgi:hypothetical protein|nr:DNA-binding protein [Prevotellaceae bacterium]